MPLYSDIAASRPPSHEKEYFSSPVEPVEHPSDEVLLVDRSGYSRTKENIVGMNDHDKRDFTSSEEHEPEFP